MILTYSLDRFVDMIRSGSKIHSIRSDHSHRWKPGMSIQHWRGNPRNVRQKPYQFSFGVCISVQKICIYSRNPEYDPTDFGIDVSVDGRLLSPAEIETLAINDGLSVAEFKAWFTPPGTPLFFGKIIHFTEKKY